MFFKTLVVELNKGYTERITGGALPCSILMPVSTAGNVGSGKIHLSGGRETTDNGSGCTTRCATVMLLLRDSCKGALMVTRI